MTTSTFTWTPEQLAIRANFADPDAGNTVIRARAGTGKTSVAEHSVGLATWAKNIIFCAFNVRIADELKSRIKDPRCTVKTVHSIGNGFITQRFGPHRVEYREYPMAVELTGDKYSKDNAPASKLAVKIKEICPTAALEDATELAWRFDCLPDTDSWRSVDDIAKLALEICKQSEEVDNVVSYADMLYLPLALNLVRPTYDLVVVDETQDLSPSQIEIVKRIVNPKGRIIVIGDDCQGIYAFRGADSNTIDNLKRELNASELGMTITHRCPKSVVELAQQLVPDYTAADCAPQGTVESLHLDAMIDKAEPGSFILSRKNAPLMSVCLALLRSGKRARIQGKDIGKELSKIVRKMKAQSVRELITKLSTWRDKEIKRAKARDNGVGSDRESQVDDTYMTLMALCEDVTGLQELNDKLNRLFSEPKDIDEREVVCSSVHKAKGLESDKVYVLTDTLYPGGRNDKEERNIHYVAITRTKDYLGLTHGCE